MEIIGSVTVKKLPECCGECDFLVENGLYFIIKNTCRLNRKLATRPYFYKGRHQKCKLQEKTK